MGRCLRPAYNVPAATKPSVPHLSKKMLTFTIPEAPLSSQRALARAPLAITTPSLGGEPHTTFEPPMINQMAHLGRLGSLPPASGDFINDIQQWFRPGALAHQMACQGMACHTYDGSPVQWDSVQGGWEEPLSSADHMCACYVARNLLRPPGTSLHAPQPRPQQQMFR